MWAVFVCRPVSGCVVLRGQSASARGPRWSRHAAQSRLLAVRRAVARRRPAMPAQDVESVDSAICSLSSLNKNEWMQFSESPDIALYSMERTEGKLA